MSGSIKLAHIRCQVMRGETLREEGRKQGKEERERESARFKRRSQERKRHSINVYKGRKRDSRG